MIPSILLSLVTIVLVILGTVAFHEIFRISLSMLLKKKKLTGIFIGIVLNLWTSLLYQVFESMNMICFSVCVGCVWFLSWAFCNFQHGDSIHTLINVYRSISFSLGFLLKVLFFILACTCSLSGYKNVMGLYWWFSDKESTYQGRRHGFDPWSAMIPHAEGQISPGTTAEARVP